MFNFFYLFATEYGLSNIKHGLAAQMFFLGRIQDTANPYRPHMLSGLTVHGYRRFSKFSTQLAVALTNAFVGFGLKNPPYLCQMLAEGI